MALPINITDLLAKNKVEGNRIEFKKGWNPAKIYQTICAFANDIDNLGGGYILVGVEEENGIAKRPVIGLSEDSIDHILKDMIGYNNKIEPFYMPRTSVEEVDGKHILAIWIPSGTERPYNVTEDVVSKNTKTKFYVRCGSSTIEAKGEIMDQLWELTNRTPFDDRGNASITIEDLSPILIYEHLNKVGSRLAKTFSTQELNITLEQMNLYDGPTERRYLKNVSAMMFCDDLQKFFPISRVEIVIFPEGRIKNPNNFYEAPIITGTVPQMIKATLNYLRIFIREHIVKSKDRAESYRYFNYPYQALEEAVVNALYHRDYQQREPIEITIEPDKISILSYSGPDRSVTLEAIRKGDVLRSRRYRNRRLGDFLKELGLTEGRSTGIPTIQDELYKNGSPRATIETDPDRTFFLIDIPCHPNAIAILPDANLSKPTECDRVRQSSIETEILSFCLEPRSRRMILESIGLKYHSDNFNKYIKPLIEKKHLLYTKPNVPNSPKQEYITSDLGKEILNKAE